MYDILQQRKTYRRYPTDLKLFIHSGGSPCVAYEHGASKSTVSYWLNSDFSNLVLFNTKNSNIELDRFREFIHDKQAQKFFDIYINRTQNARIHLEISFV